MSLNEESIVIQHDRLVRFFEIDLRPVGGYRLFVCPSLNEFEQSVIWTRPDITISDDSSVVIGPETRVVYTPLPCQIEGLDYDGSGRLPRPTLTVADITGNLGALLRALKDINGAYLITRFTWARFLDPDNFRAGNPSFNPHMEFNREIYIFNRKADDCPGEYLVFELCSALDLDGQVIPIHTYQATICDNEYGGELCNWDAAAAGRYYDQNNQPCTPDKDICSRRISGCEVRHGTNVRLPCRIFVGVQLITQG